MFLAPVRTSVRSDHPVTFDTLLTPIHKRNANCYCFCCWYLGYLSTHFIGIVCFSLFFVYRAVYWLLLANCATFLFNECVLNSNCNILSKTLLFLLFICLVIGCNIVRSYVLLLKIERFGLNFYQVISKCNILKYLHHYIRVPITNTPHLLPTSQSLFIHNTHTIYTYHADIPIVYTLSLA